MITTGKTRGKDPVVRDRLVERIRSMLVAAAWRPGERLPSRRWFEQEFDAASYTVQNAFSILIGEGFLEAEPRIGTRVARFPPYLNHYALCVGGTPRQERGIVRSLVAAAAMLRNEGRRIDLFYCNDDTYGSGDFLKLADRFHRRHFTGAYFSALPIVPERRELVLSLCNFPVTGGFRMKYARNWVCGMESRERLGDREAAMIGALAGAGVRRAGVVQYTAFYYPDFLEADYRREFSARGMTMPASGYLKIFNLDSFCDSTFRLFFRQFSPENPGGVIISDDNMVPPVIAALRDLYGDRAEAACKIVAFGNYPPLPRCDFPVKWFCADNLTGLRNGLDYLDRKRSDARVSPPVCGGTVEDCDIKDNPATENQEE